MSNLAIGIALGSSISNASRFSGGGGSIDGMPTWIAWLLLISLIICVVVAVVQAYRGKIDMLDNPWLVWIMGPLIGIVVWAIISGVVGLFGLLISLVL